MRLANNQASTGDPATWKLAWSDEFSSRAGSAPDANTWGREIGDGVAIGNPGWGTEALLPFFRAASAQLRVRIPAAAELTPWHQACLQAAPGAGFPLRTRSRGLRTPRAG